jgi:hypothetical protein
MWKARSWPQEGPWMRRGWRMRSTARGMRRYARFGAGDGAVAGIRYCDTAEEVISC